MTTIVYNECITSISLLLKNVNDLYTREKDALLKLSALEKENESLRQLLASKQTGLPKDTTCQQVGYVEMRFGECVVTVCGENNISFTVFCSIQSLLSCFKGGKECSVYRSKHNDVVNAYLQAPFPVVSQFPEESVLKESASILADLARPTQQTEQRDGKEFNGQIGCNRIKTMLQIPGMDDDDIPNNVGETECEAKLQEKSKESHSKQVEQGVSQASVKVESETMDGDIGAEKQGLEIHDLSEDDNLVGSRWPLQDRKRKREPSPGKDENRASDRAPKDTKALKTPRGVRQGNTRTPVMANARLAVIGMVFGGGICVREVDCTKEGASLETIETDFPEGKMRRHKESNKPVADVVAATATPTPQDAQRLRKSGENNAVLKCQKITDTFKCKRSGGLQGEGKVSQTNSCGRADRRNRRLLSSLVRKRGQNHSVGNAVLEELSSDTDDERETLERNGMQETSSKDSDPYIPDSDDASSEHELAATPTIARRRFKKLKKFTVPSDQSESDSEFESVLSGIQRAFNV